MRCDRCTKDASLVLSRIVEERTHCTWHLCMWHALEVSRELIELLTPYTVERIDA